MRGPLLFLILLSASCATESPVRNPSSLDTLVEKGVIDPSKSVVQVFPPYEQSGKIFSYLFVQIKDADGRYIDCVSDEVRISDQKKKTVSFKYERLSKGKFYLILEKADLRHDAIDIVIQGKPLMSKLRLYARTPHMRHSSLRILEESAHKLTLELRLKDENNEIVELPGSPEILVDGPVSLSSLTPTGPGIWTFSVEYPDENQIIYFSVKAHGATLPQLFRFQHVEK